MGGRTSAGLSQLGLNWKQPARGEPAWREGGGVWPRGRGELVQGSTGLGWVLVSDKSEVNQANVTDGVLASVKKRK